MTVKKVYAGTQGPYIYEDTDALNDPDGDFIGADRQAFITNGSGTIASSILTDLTATRLMSTDVNKRTASVTDLTSWIAGTSNQVTVTDDTDGTITLSLPQDIDTAADVDFNSISIGTTSTALTTDSSGNLIIGTKTCITPIGGFGIKLTNKTGANTVAGQLVRAATGFDDAVILTATDSPDCIGVFLESGIAANAEAWVITSGIADVAMEDNTAATHGYWVETSQTEAGYANSTSSSPVAAPRHFNEIGHCLESVAAGGAGTHILARCALHFN